MSDFLTEFNDLTRKMTMLKEALQFPSTGSDKKSGPILTNSSSQALQAANIRDVNAAKRFIHDCIMELTFVDNYLNGNEVISADLREKLQNILTREYVRGKNVVIQSSSVSPNTFELNSPSPLNVADLAIGTPEIFSNQHRKEVEIQTDSILIKVSETSNDKNKNEQSHSIKVRLEQVDKASENLNPSDRKKKRQKKKWYSICGQCIGTKKRNQRSEQAADVSSLSNLPGKSTTKSSTHLVL